MALDPYQLCPCGSGKKIKFCCSDLIGEIEKVYRMVEGDQPRAALQHVEQTLARHPRRASLLDIRASLQQSLDMLDEAKATVEQLLECDPNSPISHAQHALVASHDEDPAAAVDALQTALDLTDDHVARRVTEATGAVANAFMRLGNVVAAKAHLWIYQQIDPAGGREALDVLMKLNQYSGMPLPLRDQLQLRGLPEGHPVRREMGEIQLLALRGRWRAAAAKCDELLPDHLDEPIFFYNRALLSGYLGDTKNFIAGLRLYARQEIPFDDAVEAEAIAQHLDDQVREPHVQLHRIEYPVTGAEDALTERLFGSEIAERFELSNEEHVRIDGPQPRASFYLYDRPIPKSTAVEDLAREELPRELGLMLYFGRQTDRPPRVELSAHADRLEKASEVLDSLVGDLLGEEASRDQFDSDMPGDAIFVADWWAPTESPNELRRQWFEEERRVALLERWPDRPLRALQGKTPREAASTDELRLPLAACIYLLEESQRDDPRELFGELRKHLGVPEPGPVDPASIDFNAVPLSRLERTDLSLFDDATLESLYSRAIVANAPVVVHQLARELLSRRALAETMGMEMLYQSLFQSAPTTPDAMQALDEAREWATSQGASNGKWDLLELQLHIAESNLEGANRVMEHLRVEHGDEPEVAQQLYQLLTMLGVLGDSPGAQPMHDHHGHGDPRAHAHPSASDPQVAASGIWTPGSDAGQEKGGSKIWTPD